MVVCVSLCLRLCLCVRVRAHIYIYICVCVRACVCFSYFVLFFLVSRVLIRVDGSVWCHCGSEFMLWLLGFRVQFVAVEGSGIV